MKILRTPDDRFRDLPDFPYEPKYVTTAGLRIHYVDAGPIEGAPVLLLHGEPSWSFLYRKMIPVLTEAGHRVFAPDLVGFGRSDKPASVRDYSFERQVGWITAWLLALDLQNLTLFGQDWGSLIGMRVLAENPDRFDRLAIGNGGLPTGDRRMPQAFYLWRFFSRYSPLFPIGRIVSAGCKDGLSPVAQAAYDAPFPNWRYKAGPRAMPSLVPASPKDPATPANRAAWQVLKQWDKPTLTTFSDSDPITRGGHRQLRASIPGAKGQPHVTIEDAGHFLQEDKGEALAEVLLRFIAQTRR